MEMEMAEQISVDKCLLDLQRQWGPERTLISRGFPHHTWSIFFSNVGADSSMLRTGSFLLGG